MRFYSNFNDSTEVFETLREAAKAYLNSICKNNEQLKDNEYYYQNYADVADCDVSVEIYHIKNTDKYFFCVDAENIYTNSGNLLKMIVDDDIEKDLINTFDAEKWTVEVDADYIEVDYEKDAVLE